MSQMDKIWFAQRRWFFLRYSKIENNSLKNFTTYWQQRNSPIVCRCCLSPFSWIGTTFDFFQLLRKDPPCKRFFKIIDRGLNTEESHIFNNLIDISSFLSALSIFKGCMILRISWSLNEIDDKLALVTGVVTRGKVLLFETGVHWDAKKKLKWFAFSLKFDINLLLIKMGGINLISFPL